MSFSLVRVLKGSWKCNGNLDAMTSYLDWLRSISPPSGSFQHQAGLKLVSLINLSTRDPAQRHFNSH